MMLSPTKMKKAMLFDTIRIQILSKWRVDAFAYQKGDVSLSESISTTRQHYLLDIHDFIVDENDLKQDYRLVYRAVVPVMSFVFYNIYMLL